MSTQVQILSTYAKGLGDQSKRNISVVNMNLALKVGWAWHKNAWKMAENSSQWINCCGSMHMVNYAF